VAHDDVGSQATAGSAGALRQSEERFRLLVESVVDYAIFILDPTGIITTWNIGAERLKGYSESEIVGRHYSTFYTEEDRRQGLPDRLLETAREDGHVQISGWRVRKDGTRFWADVVITALRSDGGELAGFAKVTRDMTEPHRARQAQKEALEQQRQLTARLEALDRWRRDFMSAITHDLIVPVIAIAGFADHLLDEVEDAEQREVLERIVSNSEALRAMIDQLSVHARLESGEVSIHREPVRLDLFVSDLLADLRPLLSEHPVRTTVPPLELLADRRGLERILRNLLGNAARHTPPSTPISVEAHLEDQAVTITVADEGQGIPEALRDRLFERSSHGASAGSGLGLSIVKEYVELHGGVVEVETDIDRGTTFRVSLPAGPVA